MVPTERDSDHETLLFATEVHWLPKGNMLGRLFEPRKQNTWQTDLQTSIMDM